MLYALAGVLTVAEYWVSALQLLLGKDILAWAASYQQAVQGLIDTANPVGHLALRVGKVRSDADRKAVETAR